MGDFAPRLWVCKKVDKNTYEWVDENNEGRLRMPIKSNENIVMFSLHAVDSYIIPQTKRVLIESTVGKLLILVYYNYRKISHTVQERIGTIFEITKESIFLVFCRVVNYIFRQDNMDISAVFSNVIEELYTTVYSHPVMLPNAERFLILYTHYYWSASPKQNMPFGDKRLKPSIQTLLANIKASLVSRYNFFFSFFF